MAVADLLEDVWSFHFDKPTNFTRFWVFQSSITGSLLINCINFQIPDFLSGLQTPETKIS